MDYEIGDLDKNGAVKPGFAVYLLAAFLCRQLFYAPLALAAKRSGRGGGGSKNLDLSFLQVTSIWEFAACLPAAVIIFLLIKNREGVSDVMRKIWLNGKNLLLLAVGLQVAVQVLYYLQAGAQPSAVGLALGVAYLYCVYYLLTNQRVKDVFSQVPV